MSGPRFTEANILAYLRDEGGSPVESQWLDQMFAATDELRATTGEEPNRELLIASDRKRAAMTTMFLRLLAESDGDRCGHLLGRVLQPTYIDPVAHKQMCAQCWDSYEWVPLADDLTVKEARKLSCDCCEKRFTRRWDDFDNFKEGIWTETWRWWCIVAPLRLCQACHRLINYSNEALPLEVQDGLLALRHPDKDETNR